MRQKMNYQEIMWAEQKVDIYAGPNCDEWKGRWYCYADGDKEGGYDSSITLSPANFPPGTKVVISVPCCPRCDMQIELCESSDCIFDWVKWTEEQYS